MRWFKVGLANLLFCYLLLLTLQFYFLMNSKPPKLAHLEWLRKTDKTVVPSTHPQNFLDLTSAFASEKTLPLIKVDGNEILPLGGLTNRPTLYCEEDDGWLVFASDPYGFNNPRAASEPFDYVIIGDSFVQGACVPPGSTFVDVMRARGLRIYNLGTGGAGPLTQLALVREFSPTLRPKTILWTYTDANDLMRLTTEPSDLEFEMNSFVLMSYLNDPNFSQHLVDRREKIDAALGSLIETTIENRLNSSSQLTLQFLANKSRARWQRYQLERSNREPHPERGLVYQEKLLPLFRQILIATKTFTEQLGAKLIFVYLPMREPHPLTPDVLDLVRSLDIEAIDLTYLSSPHQANLWVQNGYHYSIRGNAIIASELERHSDQRKKGQATFGTKKCRSKFWPRYLSVPKVD